MGISNETYVVHTAAKGDLVVGIGEYVIYDKVTLVGYNAYNYHSYISQSLVNLNDQINLLKGGTAAQATAELETAVNDAKKVITDEVAKINTAIIGLIEENLNQTISETKSQNKSIINSLNDVTHSANKSSTDIVSLDERLISIEHELEDPKTLLGIRATLASYLNSITSIYSKIGEVTIRNADNSITAGFGLLEDVSILKSSVEAIPSHTVKIKSIQDLIGTSYNNSTTTLSEDTLSMKKIVFKDGVIPNDYSGVGIYDEIYNTSTGIKVRLTAIDSALIQINSLSSSQSNSAAVLSDAVHDISVLDSSISDLQAIVGTATSGLRKKVSDLEGINISVNLNNINSNLSNLQTVIGDGNSGLVKQANKSTADILGLITKYNALKTVNDSQDTSITNINSNLSTLNTFAANLNSNIDKHYTINGTIYNAAKLKDIDTKVSNLNSKDRSAQFDAYFKSGSNYKSDIEFCQPGIQNWTQSNANNGMKALTNGFISSYLTADTNYKLISNMNNTLNVLTGSVTTVGSIDKRINDAFTNFKQLNIDPINTVNIAQGSSIATLTDNATTVNNRVAAVENTLPTINTKINEIDNEAVKFSVLLPFMKRMILMAKDENVTSENIVSTFDAIINNLSKLSDTYSNNGTVTLTVSTGNLNFLITSDKLTSTDYFNYIDSIEYYVRLRYFDGVDHYILPLTSNVNGLVVSGNIEIIDDQEFYKVDKMVNDGVLATFITPKQTLTLSQILLDKSGKPDASLVLDTMLSHAEDLDGYESFLVKIL